MQKTAEILTWVFFVSQGVTDNTDVVRAFNLCSEICIRCVDNKKPTLGEIKETSGYRGTLYDLPDKLITDEKIQEMIDWK